MRAATDPPRFQISHHAAVTAQQVCSIGLRRNLNGCNGISKTVAWKKCAPGRNFADARTFPMLAADNRDIGLLFMPGTHEET
jgi:hypothetical protein